MQWFARRRMSTILTLDGMHIALRRAASTIYTIVCCTNLAPCRCVLGLYTLENIDIFIDNLTAASAMILNYNCNNPKTLLRSNKSIQHTERHLLCARGQCGSAAIPGHRV